MVWGGLAVVQRVFAGPAIGHLDDRMDQRGDEPTSADFMKRLPARLWEVRWPLAAAAIAFPAATALGGGSMPLALGAVAIVLLAAALLTLTVFILLPGPAAAALLVRRAARFAMDPEQAARSAEAFSRRSAMSVLFPWKS